MSNLPIDVWLDEERQIVRRRVSREPRVEDFRRIIEKSDECVSRLRDPLNVRILVDGEWSGRMKKNVRTMSIVKAQ